MQLFHKKIFYIPLILIIVTLVLLLSYNPSQKNMMIDLSFVTILEDIAPSEFPNNTCNIIDYGAINNQSTEAGMIIQQNTQAFKKAITDCIDKGGGTVLIPDGIWKTGSIHLGSNIKLHLEENAHIIFSDNPTDYLPVVKTRYIGLEVYNYSPMIYAANCNNIAITGNGTINGSGQSKDWQEFLKHEKETTKKLYKMTLHNIPIEERNFGSKNIGLRP